MRPTTFIPAIYAALLVAFRNGASVREAASAAGCSTQIAHRALTGAYAAQFAWAPAIRDVLSGAIQTPKMPAVWPPPTMPKLEPAKPQPRLSVVRKEPTTDKPTGPEPDPLAPPPARDASETTIVSTGNDGLDALAEYRQSLTQRARAMASAGHDLDRVVKWLTAALVEFAESMSKKGASVALNDLTSMAQAIGLVASSMDKFGAALERAVAAESKLKPKEKPKDEGDGWAEVMAKRKANG